MTKPRIWADLLLHSQAQELARQSAELIGPWQGNTSSTSDPLEGIEEADAVVVSPRTLWTTPIFQRAPSLVAVSRAGIGFENLDLPAMTQAGVCGINTPDGPTESTAEHAIMLMMCLTKKAKAADKMLAAGKRDFRSLMGIELLGKTLGVVGIGRIGSRVAQIAQVLGMRIIAYDPYVSAEYAATREIRLIDNLPEVLANADVVTLHLPASAATRKLFDAQAFAKMKPGALFINCARGPIVDEAALYTALTQGYLGGAGLDVWDPEPPSADNPLLALDNVVGTPHSASFTDDGLRKMGVVAVEQALMVLKGQKPPHLLNPEVWGNQRQYRKR